MFRLENGLKIWRKLNLNLPRCLLYVGTNSNLTRWQIAIVLRQGSRRYGSNFHLVPLSLSRSF